MERLAPRLYVALPIIFLMGCAGQQVSIKVTHPPEVDLSAYRHLLILPLQGEQGSSFSDAFNRQLAQHSSIERLDRTTLRPHLTKLQLNESDLSSAQARQKLAGEIPATVMLTGHIKGHFNTQLDSRPASCWQEKREVPCQKFTRTGTYNGLADIELIDLAHDEGVIRKHLSETCEIQLSALERRPQELDEEPLRQQCLHKLVEQLIRTISPSKVDVPVILHVDPDLPELEIGIRYARIGDLDQAIIKFSEAIRAAEKRKLKDKVKAKAYWNLALALEYSGYFKEAEQALDRGFIHGGSERFIHEKDNIARLRLEKKRRLDAQTAISQSH